MIEDKAVVCPRCGNDSLRKNGPRLSVRKGVQQQFQCKKCAHVFVIKEEPQVGRKET